MKYFVVVGGKKKQFLFYFSDLNEHFNHWRSVPQCLCAVSNTLSIVLGAVLWVAEDVQGSRTCSPLCGSNGLCSEVEPAPGLHPCIFSLLLTPFFFSFSKFSSGGLCWIERGNCFVCCSKNTGAHVSYLDPTAKFEPSPMDSVAIPQSHCLCFATDGSRMKRVMKVAWWRRQSAVLGVWR